MERDLKLKRNEREIPLDELKRRWFDSRFKIAEDFSEMSVFSLSKAFAAKKTNDENEKKSNAFVDSEVERGRLIAPAGSDERRHVTVFDLVRWASEQDVEVCQDKRPGGLPSYVELAYKRLNEEEEKRATESEGWISSPAVRSGNNSADAQTPTMLTAELPVSNAEVDINVPNHNSTPTGPYPRLKWQEDQILRGISELGYDATSLPKYKNGTATTKAKVKQKLVDEDCAKWSGRTVFDKAWDRLRGDKRIAEEVAHPQTGAKE
jgi:hypothetical protein